MYKAYWFCAMLSKPLKSSDLDICLDTLLTSRSWAAHHIDNFNHFINAGLKQIVCKLFVAKGTVYAKKDSDIATIEYITEFLEVRVEPPSLNCGDNVGARMMPYQARLGGYTYSSPLLVDYKVTAIATKKNGEMLPPKEEFDTNFHIASIPMMLKSDKCNTHSMSKEELLRNNEDPFDVGGYYIIKGNEWSIDLIENMRFNKPNCNRNVGFKDEWCRCSFISKPGDDYEHSTEHIFTLFNSGNIALIFNHPTFKEQELPFYLYCRLLVDASDKMIMDNICGEYTSEIGVDLANIAAEAMRQEGKFPGARAMRNRTDILDKLASGIYKPDSKGNKPDEHVVRTQLMSKIDDAFMPHLGRNRYAKFRFVCEIVRHVILVYLGVIPSTDRDSYVNKRLSAAGVSYSKLFKRKFNHSVIKPVISEMENAFENMEFSKINLVQTFRSAVDSAALQRELIQVITTSSVDDNNPSSQKAKSRLSTQQLMRKNELNTISILRTIRSPNTNQATSKSDKRADLLRRVQPSYWRYICPIQSADTGMMVGVTKQMAIAAELTGSTPGEFLKDSLFTDSELVRWTDISAAEFYAGHKYGPLFRVLVNGEIIGGVENPYTFVRKWQLHRRRALQGQMKINPKTSIHVEYETGRVEFHTDMGRITCLTLVVVNNDRDYDDYPHLFSARFDVQKADNFEQTVLINREHLDKLWADQLSITDLITEGLIEYISAEEQEICLTATSPEEVAKFANDPTMAYTHCSLPEMMLGLVAHVTLFGEHNQLVRNTYNSNQTKQAGGHYVTMFWTRVDKQRFYQYVCERPKVTTLANRYIKPNGCNTMYALMCYSGMNQEDSLIGNETSFESGLFSGAYFTYMMTEQETNERFGIPNESNILGLKSKANYSHLVNGVVKPGTTVHKDDVLIAKTVMFEKPISKFRFQDRSVTWPYDEEALVEMAFKNHNQDDKLFYKIKLSSELPIEKGDKMSSRFGQKGVISNSYRAENMPFDINGLSPDVLMNPNSIPTRMTIGQLMEPPIGLLGAMKGCDYDGTVFHDKNIKAIGLELEKHGLHRSGYRVMYNGMTGRTMPVMVFFGIVFYQRLNKFSKDDKKVVTTTRTDILTRQPERKGGDGGLRIGEMERDCLMAHGAGLFFMSKFLDDADDFQVYYCRNCQNEAIVNEKQKYYVCSECKEPDIVRIKMPWANQLFFKQLGSCHIGTRITPNPYERDQYY